MTPIEVTRQMLGHLNLTDEQLHIIRDLVDIQADIVVRGFWERHKEAYEKLYEAEVGSRGVSGVQQDGLVDDTSRTRQSTLSEMDGVSGETPQ
jgi:hypothetical protein